MSMSLCMLTLYRDFGEKYFNVTYVYVILNNLWLPCYEYVNVIMYVNFVSRFNWKHFNVIYVYVILKFVKIVKEKLFGIP